MNRARIFRTVILPLLIAGLATLGLYQVISGRQARPVAPVVDTIKAAVAARDIPARTLITTEMVAIRDVPAAYVLAGTVRTLDACTGRITLVPLSAGETVLTSKLTTAQPGSAGLSFMIAPGKRAMTVQVDEIIGVAAFPRPGDAVDILVTFLQTAQTTAGVDQRTRLLLENLRILAVVQDVGASEDTVPREIKGYTSLTLEVAPEQAAIIAAAEAQGLLRFLLRPALDSVTIGEFDVSGGGLRQAVHTLNTDIERRVGFEVRLLEVDNLALASLGHGTYGTSVSSISAEAVGMLLNLREAGQARELRTTTSSTSNRTAVSFTVGGEASDPAHPTGQAVPYGLEIQVTPSYYGQLVISVDARVTLRMIDLNSAGALSTAILTTGAVERLAAGEAMMVVGLAAAEDFAAALAELRLVLPAELITAELAAGQRAFVVLITPSF